MLVQRVALPTARVDSWTVLGDDDVPVESIERYLAYLTDIDRSPNTVRAYAYDLKDYWTFLGIGDWTGGRSAWRTWVSTSPGCSCRPRPQGAGRGAAVGAAARQRVHDQPQAVGTVRVLPTSCDTVWMSVTC